MTAADFVLFVECSETFFCACSSECRSLMMACSEAGASVLGEMPLNSESRILSAIARPPAPTIIQDVLCAVLACVLQSLRPRGVVLLRSNASNLTSSLNRANAQQQNIRASRQRHEGRSTACAAAVGSTDTVNRN
eukprot:6213449-Pleurochrysis_carterae.AAC.4